MAINIRAHSRDVAQRAGATGHQQGTFRGRDFGASGTATPAGGSTPRGSRSNRSDVSIQVDVNAKAMSRSGSKKGQPGKSGGATMQRDEIPLYSREDICEQYVINKKGMESRRRGGFFGFLTSRSKDNSVGKSKKTKRSLFGLCVRRSSDENLYNGCNKPVVNANRSITLPALKPFTVPLREDGPNSSSSLFRNRPQSFCTSDPRRFSVQPSSTTPCIVNSYAPRHSDPDWKISTIPIQTLSSDGRSETASAGAAASASLPFRYGGRLAYTQPNTPEMSIGLYRRHVMSSDALMQGPRDGRFSIGSSKHVSFDASSPTSEIYTAAVPANAPKSAERLLDGRKTPESYTEASRRQHSGAAFSPVLARAILLERLRQASMRSQATQTDQGYYNSTTSLSYPSTYSRAESQTSISAAPIYATVNRHVQTSSESRAHRGIAPGGRLCKSSSAVDREFDDEDDPDERHFQQQQPPEGLLSSRRSMPEELSRSQPEKLGVDCAGSRDVSGADTSPGRSTINGRPRSKRRHQLLKALSEGTVLLDRKKAHRFASGYVEVNVHDTDEAVNEAVAGRVLVQDPMLAGSSEDDVDDDELMMLDGQHHPGSSLTDTNRSVVCSEADVDGCWSDLSAGQPKPLAASTVAARLAGQKSFDSNASLPDTPGYSDEFGSTSQVTVLQPHVTPSSGYVVCDSDPAEEPPTPPPRRPQHSSGSSLPPPVPGEPSDSEKEIMVQFPPWPQAQDSLETDQLIPAPPNFAADDIALEDIPPPPEEEVGVEQRADQALIPPPDLSPPTSAKDRVTLRHLKSSGKSLSETITSLDSDSSGRRATEHETSASGSEPLSSTSEVNSPPQVETMDVESGNRQEADSADNSEFLTAVSDHLTGLTGSGTIYNTAMELKSERSWRESDTSHNSTLRMDHSNLTLDLPYESPMGSNGGQAERTPPAAELASPESVEGVDGIPDCGRDSSTSGSYSLMEATPVDPSPPPPLPGVGQGSASKDIAIGTEMTSRQKRTIKEGMKLQFPPGATMFTSATSTSTPTKSSRRKQHLLHQLSSSDSDNEVLNNSERSAARAKRRNHRSNNDSDSVGKGSRSGAGHSSLQRDKKSRSRSRNSGEWTASTPSAENASRPSSTQGGHSKKRDVAAESVTTPGMVRSPAMHEGFRVEDWIVDYMPAKTPTGTTAEHVPLPISGADVYTVNRPGRTSDPSVEHQPPMEGSKLSMARWLAPSPSKNGDSVRSISPGSDNVFASESVEAATMKPPEGFADSPIGESTPPEGSGGARRKTRDSGKRTKSCTLPPAQANASASGSTLSLEGMEKEDATGPHRAVSANDMWYPETQLPPKRQLTVRAKSEERERWNRPARRNLVNLAKSIEANWDPLGISATYDGTPLDDEDAGIYNASYRSASWAYIGETEELQVWHRSQPSTPLHEADDSSTASEKDFRRKYTSITHRMVHRKSSVEMFRRLATSTFDQTDDPKSARGSAMHRSLAGIFRLMLMIWCRESLALRRLSLDDHHCSLTGECDDIVLVKRESGEFGFRIHGSRPVVVSAIEPNTPAELSGLQVGDIIISINDVNVLDSSHSDVVRIAHTGTDELKLEVARTRNVLAIGSTNELIQKSSEMGDAVAESTLLSGYLWKKSHTGSKSIAVESDVVSDNCAPVWYRRWFALKKDNCLYYYKNSDSSQPLGAVSLLNYTVTRSAFTDRPHGLLLSKGGTIRHWLAAESAESVEQWQIAFIQASQATVQDVWLDLCAESIQLPPASMISPDCVGHLMKLGHRAKEWQRRFCVLKDACLYFYVDTSSSSALGALHLHGYRVQGSGATVSSGERKKYAFELLPPEPRMRHFHFYTDAENDRKRWIAALEYSIDRWIRVG